MQTPVLSDGGDWWLQIVVDVQGKPENRYRHWKVLQWERTVDRHEQPAMVAWLNAKTPVRSDRIEDHHTMFSDITRGAFVRLSPADITALDQAGTWKVYDGA